MTHDVFAAGIVVALTIAALSAFGVRLLRRGAGDIRFERVNALGGSRLLSKRLVEMGYWAILPVARACVAARITPNHITWASLALGVAAGISLAFGFLGLGGLLGLFSALGDILDGQVARLGGNGSAAGEILDASVDRTMEFVFIGGLAVFYRANVLYLCIALAAMFAAFMVSYSTAKAEAKHIAPPRGAMRRHERSVYLISGAVLSSILAPWIEPLNPVPGLQAPLMLAALAIVAVAGNLSAVRRLVLVARALRPRDSGRA
jgi:CDP-diacylglycerol---glycerol-3-phosphate 3-phosphatidyltransferase